MRYKQLTAVAQPQRIEREDNVVLLCVVQLIVFSLGYYYRRSTKHASVMFVTLTVDAGFLHIPSLVFKATLSCGHADLP